MGLLGELGEQLMSHAMAGNASAPVAGGQVDPKENAIAGVMDVINHPSVGGIAGLARLFQSNGLGQTMAGWTGNGPNPQVSGGQLQQVLGSAPIAAFAQRLGIPADQAASHLAQLLPYVIDHLTPDGVVPPGGVNTQSAITELKSHLFG